MHGSIRALLTWGSLLGLSQAACPYADPAALKEKREDAKSSDFLDQYKVDDSNGYMTSDVGGPIEDQFSLKAGIRGSTLLEDFIFRQKIQHFDHERVSTKKPLPCLRHPRHLRHAVLAKILTCYLPTRFPNGLSMLAVQEPTAHSPAMPTGAISRPRLS